MRLDSETKKLCKEIDRVGKKLLPALYETNKDYIFVPDESAVYAIIEETGVFTADKKAAKARFMKRRKKYIEGKKRQEAVEKVKNTPIKNIYKILDLLEKGD